MNFFEKISKNILNFPSIISLFTLLVISYFFIDRQLANLIHSTNLSWMHPWIDYVTDLGRGRWYILLLPIVAIFFRYIVKNKFIATKLLFVWLCVFTPYTACFILKSLLGRARPELFFSQDIYGFFGPSLQFLYNSFPSGHSTSIIGIASALSFFRPRYSILFFGVGVLVMISRLLLLKHYLSDVLMGGVIALMVVKLLQIFLQKNFGEFYKKIG